MLRRAAEVWGGGIFPILQMLAVVGLETDRGAETSHETVGHQHLNGPVRGVTGMVADPAPNISHAENSHH